MDDDFEPACLTQVEGPMQGVSDDGTPPGSTLEDHGIPTQEVNNSLSDNGELCSLPRNITSGFRYGAAATCEVLDDVHKPYSLHSVSKEVVKTYECKRLRRLRQLGMACAVFPNATHNRFEHSQGVAHLGGWLLRNLCTHGEGLGLGQREQQDALRIVELAGLVHDFGHGPLSHVFEKEFLRQANVLDWEHEAMSCQMLQLLIDRNPHLNISQEDCKRINMLVRGMKGEERRTTPRGELFLYDIVANDHNGVDVDRADYLLRDAQRCGVRLRSDIRGLLQSARVVDGQVCYPEGQVDNVYNVFKDRIMMFQNVYVHRRVKAFELMATDALLLANPVLKLSDRVHEAENFATLDDGVLPEIANFRHARPSHYAALSASQRSDLDAAAALVRSLDAGLGAAGSHVPVAEAEVPRDWVADGRWEALRSRFTEAEVASCYPAGSVAGVRELRARDIAVSENRLDFGKKGGNPMATVCFFREWEPDAGSYTLNPDSLARLPVPHPVRTLRVYCRGGDTATHRAALAAFRGWCGKHLSTCEGGVAVRDGAELEREEVEAGLWGERRQREQQEQQQQQLSQLGRLRSSPVVVRSEAAARELCSPAPALPATPLRARVGAAGGGDVGVAVGIGCGGEGLEGAGLAVKRRRV